MSLNGVRTPEVDLKKIVPELPLDELPDLPGDDDKENTPPDVNEEVPLENNDDETESETETVSIPLGYNPITGEIYHNQEADPMLGIFYRDL